MTSKAIPFYWKKSSNALRAARALYELELYDDSISRSYYAVLNAARAVLLIHGIKTKRHSAVQRCFGKYLIQTNELEKEWSTILNHEYFLRTSADYEEQFEASGEMVEEMLTEAERFVKRMKEYLLAKGISLPNENR